jgi:hypothetical protein
MIGHFSQKMFAGAAKRYLNQGGAQKGAFTLMSSFAMANYMYQ